jgi:hypothetical protein
MLKRAVELVFCNNCLYGNYSDSDVCGYPTEAHPSYDEMKYVFGRKKSICNKDNNCPVYCRQYKHLI